VCFVLAGVALGHAQTPPASAPPPPATQPKSITGFVPTYEIMRTVRAAGFQPLEPPLREGRTYVLRATDFRGILMHVVLDARTGAIRDVTRIVEPYRMMPPPDAPGPYGPSPYAPPPAAAPSYGPPPYEGPAEYEPPGPRIGSEEGGAIPTLRPGVAPTARSPAASARSQTPPLPRSRPIVAPPKSAEQPADDASATNATRASPPVTSGTSKTAPVAPLND
jgi:protein transport protein SEC31